MKKRMLSMVLMVMMLMAIAIPSVAFAQGEAGNTVAAGYGSTYYIKEDGSLWGFGDNELGQIGNGTLKNDVTQPYKIMDDVKSVAVSNRNAFAIKKDNSLWGWGASSYVLGNGTLKSSLVPIKLMDDVKMVSPGAGCILIIKTDGSLWVCGSDVPGRLGDMGKEYNSQKLKKFTQIFEGEKFKFVCAAEANAFFIKENGELWGWGRNFYGTLGLGHENPVPTPVKIMDDVKYVAGTAPNTMLVKNDGSLWTCGYGNNGKYYDGEKTIDTNKVGRTNAFKKVMDNVLYAAMPTGGYSYYVIKTDHTLWGWGNNRIQIMNSSASSTANIDQPVQIMTDVNLAVLGERHLVVVKVVEKDSTLWTGGENFRGGILGAPIGKIEPRYPMKKAVDGIMNGYEFSAEDQK